MPLPNFCHCRTAKLGQDGLQRVLECYPKLLSFAPAPLGKVGDPFSPSPVLIEHPLGRLSASFPSLY
jgi:hypothetical protein